jgi:MFS family permease
MAAPHRPDAQVPYPWLPESERRMPPASDTQVPQQWPQGSEWPMPPTGSDGQRGASPGGLVQRLGLSGYVAFGGSAIGAFVGHLAAVFATEGSARGLEETLGLGVVAGSVAGLAVGWVSLWLVGRRVDGPDTRRPTGPIALLLMLPAYLVAGGVGAAAAELVHGLRPDEVLGSLPGLTAVLIVAYVVVAPLSLAFAPGEPSRPKVMAGSLAGCSGTFWVAGFAVAWFLGSFMAVLLILAGIEALNPAGYSAAVEGSPAFLVAWFACWLGVWIGGTAAVYRLVRWRLTRR